jgi:hypothetical protein
MQELRGRRSSIFPPIPKRTSIGDYTSGELRQLYNWVTSDGQLRTHDEITDEMFAALPFSRRGSKDRGRFARHHPPVRTDRTALLIWMQAMKRHTTNS